MNNSFCSVYYCKKQGHVTDDLIGAYLPEGCFKRILIKPNWVMHSETDLFPIEALVTRSALIGKVVDACLKKYPEAEELVVADVPLQSCNWDKLIGQLNLHELMNRYKQIERPKISFLDLRRERYQSENGYLKKNTAWSNGDPKGYREVILDAGSFLDPISDSSNRFRVSDYDPLETTSSHRQGYHRYLISGTVLASDLVINMPKIKTHQKAGVTGALKNLVGINGNKAFLVHHRRGRISRGGDEFPSDIPAIVFLQTRLRDVLQKKSRLLFLLGRYAWKGIKTLKNIKTEGTPENLHKRFYVAGGSWHGNDTVWRMIYDLNKIVLHAPIEGGRLAESPQRQYLCILDGIIAGEGNGPIQPLPVKLNIVGFSNDPFLMDMVMARFMGFDYAKIPQLKNYNLFIDDAWAKFNPNEVKVMFDEQIYHGINQLPVLHKFIPPPGWKDHIEYV